MAPIKTRLLTEGEYQATFGRKMHDITGQEEELSPEGVIDIRPYVMNIPEEDLQGARHRSTFQVEVVYRNKVGHYDHVLVPCKRANLYIVVVVRYLEGEIYGHYLLDLLEKYGQ